jgi:hypothetical protein
MMLCDNLVAQRVFSSINVDFYANSIDELYEEKVVYLLVVPTDKGDYCYVGQAAYGIYKRICSHCSDAFKRTDNSKKANAFKKYRYIKAYILEKCKDDIDVDIAERKYIELFYKDKSYARCLNTLLCVKRNGERITVHTIDEKYKIECYTLRGEYVKTYNSIREAAYLTGICRNVISRALRSAKTAGGFQWKRQNDPRVISEVLPHCPSVRKSMKAERPVQPHILESVCKPKEIVIKEKVSCMKNLKVIKEGKKKFLKMIRRKHTVETKQEKKIREQKARGIVILQYDLQGQYITSFPSLQETARQTNTNVKAIEMCCKGAYKQAKGFQYRKKGSDLPVLQDVHTLAESTTMFNIASKGKPVVGCDADGNIVERYDSKRKAEIAHNCYGLLDNIRKRTARFGLYWKFL